MSEPRKKARRCAMCGMVNRPTAHICECGHHFDDDEDLEPFLRARVTTGWMLVIFGLLFTIASMFLIAIGLPGMNDPRTALFSRIIGISTAAASVAMFVKGTRVVDAARHRLRELRAIPRAKVVKR